MTGRPRNILLAGLGGVAGSLLILVGCWALGGSGMPGQWVPMGRLPGIRPDYVGLVIPPNIAPLNFVIEEPGKEFRVRIHARNGQRIDIPSRDSSIVIPIRPWRELLAQNRGGRIGIDVYARGPGGLWRRFDRIENIVASEEIDSRLVYRLLGPVFRGWNRLGLYQRNLENYEESAVVRNESLDRGCLNCHAFPQNRPDRFSLQARSPFPSGMVVAREGKAVRIKTKSNAAPKPPGYTSWHPSGFLVAVSMNTIGQYMHGVGPEVREVFDLDSDLAVINFKTGEVSTTGGIADPDRLETFPAWSPDGKYLYFCSARPLWGRNELPSLAQFEKVRYDLMRIPYDIQTNTWGKAETLLTAQQAGLSISEPRISPDGRFLLFCMADHGAFPVLENTSDLYLMDLSTGKYRPLENANSPQQADSWHCWSGNSRWIVFSSKRGDGLFARPYICYIDAEGKDHKPFVLPQKDPLFYDTFLKTYNVPELVSGPIRVTEGELTRVIKAETAEAITGATPVAK